MNHFKQKIITLPLLLSGFALSMPAGAYNLQQAVEQAVTSNPEVVAQMKNKQSISEEIKQAKAGYYPTIDLQAGIGREWSDNNTTRAARGGSENLERKESSIQLRQMLFDGWGTKSEVGRQESRYSSSDYLLKATSEQIAADAIASYLEVLKQQQIIEAAKTNLVAHQRIHDQIEMRSRSGADDQAALSQIRGRLALAQSNVEAQQNNLQDAVARYEEVVGPFPEEKLEEVDFGVEVPKTYEAAVDEALVNHPRLLSAKADIKATEYQHEAAKREYYPRFDLELSATANDNLDGQMGNDDDAQAMIRMRYNLFRGGADKARVSQTAYQIEEATEVSNTTKRQVEKSVKVAWDALQYSQRREAYLQDYVASTRYTQDAYEKQFRIGERTLLDLLDTSNEVFRAQEEYYTNHYDIVLAKYRLLTSTGRLLERFAPTSTETTTAEASQ